MTISPQSAKHNINAFCTRCVEALSSLVERTQNVKRSRGTCGQHVFHFVFAHTTVSIDIIHVKND